MGVPGRALVLLAGLDAGSESGAEEILRIGSEKDSEIDSEQ
jgi:hypothetical protein